MVEIVKTSFFYVNHDLIVLVKLPLGDRASFSELDYGLLAASHRKDITHIDCSTRFIAYNFCYCIVLCFSEQK